MPWGVPPVRRRSKKHEFGYPFLATFLCPRTLPGTPPPFLRPFPETLFPPFLSVGRPGCRGGARKRLQLFQKGAGNGCEVLVRISLVCLRKHRRHAGIFSNKGKNSLTRAAPAKSEVAWRLGWPVNKEQQET